MTREQVEIVRAAEEALERDDPFAVCIALETEGSSPRSAGTWMGLRADGRTVGTIGGGSLERIAVREGLEALGEGRSRCVHHLLSGARSDTGMVCGGSISLCHLVLKPADRGAVSQLARLLESQEGGWMVLEDLGGAVRLRVHARSRQGDALPSFIDPDDEAPRLLKEDDLFVQGVRRGAVCYVFGGGYVGQALAAVLAQVGFSVTVVDDRPGLARPELFPESVPVVLGDYGDIAASVAIAACDAVIVATASHASDAAVAEQALRLQPAYLGCLGSARKTRYLREKLGEKGFSPEEIDSLHMPIGYDIGAEGPGEIAVSIAAELIAWRRLGRAAPERP